MSQPAEAYTSNLLLNAMSADDLALLSPSLVRVEIQPEQVLQNANGLIEHLYFLEGGIASIVSIRPDSGRTEVPGHHP